jgi:probable F420-dependent oxidoreductase
MNIGKLGVWVMSDMFAAPELTAIAQRVEKWGYGALWIPEALGRDAFVASSWLLANTKTLNIATGIANIYARHPLTAVCGQYAVAEQSGGRFLLGLGVSHEMIVNGLRGQSYEKPIPTMQAYLRAMAERAPPPTPSADVFTAMAQGKYTAPPPAMKPKTILGALGPKMLEVSATLADGAHPYNVPPEHTVRARKIMGPGKLLCPEQKVLLEKDASTARALGRKMFGMSLLLPNYRNNMKRLGFTDADCENGGSDRLVDALLAWGDEKAIRARLQEHWDAGADHVCIQVVPKDGVRMSKDDEKILELLAPR